MARREGGATREKRRILLTSALCALGVAFMGLGIWRSEVETVIRKAINVCLECIGIG